MPTLTKQQYAEIYKREEFNPAGLCRLIYILSAIAIAAAVIFGISHFAGKHRASGQAPQEKAVGF
jgi:hypothetical protein